MPCQSDYLAPTQRERLLQETAQLYAYVLIETNQRVPGDVADAANDIYCRTDFVSHLCEQLTYMDSDTRHRVVYNAHDKKSRQLADWWERHQAADQQRIALEQAARETPTWQQALAKLTVDEIAALRRYFNG